VRCGVLAKRRPQISRQQVLLHGRFTRKIVLNRERLPNLASEKMHYYNISFGGAGNFHGSARLATLPTSATIAENASRLPCSTQTLAPFDVQPRALIF
jgi:hypothetical protein